MDVNPEHLANFELVRSRYPNANCYMKEYRWEGGALKPYYLVYPTFGDRSQYLGAGETLHKAWAAAAEHVRNLPARRVKLGA